MKYIIKIFILISFIFGTISCEKNENFEILNAQESFRILTPTNGSEIILDDTNTTNNALFLSWESSGSETDYTINVAKTGTNFESPIVLVTTQDLNFSMSVEEVNTFLLDVLNLNPDEANSLDFRVSSNSKVSETIAVVFTAYSIEYEEFYLVGSLTNWDPVEALAMNHVDVNIFDITVNLVVDDEFKFLPTNTSFDGDWGEDPNNLGNLIVDGEQNISGLIPGEYKITINLNTFTFTTVILIPSTKIAVPGNHQGVWDPATAPLLAASNFDTTDYEGYVWLDGGYKFLAPDVSGNFDWGNTDWGDDGSFTGILVETDEVDCNATTAGYYFVEAETTTLTYSTTAVNWGIIGNATPTGWDSDTDLIYDSTTRTLSVDIDLIPGPFKFRGNDEWGSFDLGTVDSDGFLQSGGDLTFDSPAGNYHVVLDLSNPREYTFSLTLN